MSDNPIGLIAGAGLFPAHVARSVKHQGKRIVSVGIRDWVGVEVAQEVDTYTELRVGQLSRLISWFKGHNVEQVVMAGKVTKQVLFDERDSFDEEMTNILSSLKDASIGSLLGAIAASLSKSGLTLIDSSTFLQSALCPEGVLGSITPTEIQMRDIELGSRVARSMAAFDIGQTVVVKEGVVLAVEALEGTDAAIRRGHTVSGKGSVVVKTGASDQDRRFDLPVIGEETIKTLIEAGVSCLAVEAGTTLILDRDKLISLADKSKISFVGLSLGNN